MVAGGVSNVASGSNATGSWWILQHGGRREQFCRKLPARANHDGVFVLADRTISMWPVRSRNTWRGHFTGGMRMIVAIDGTGNYTVNCLLSQGTGS